MGIWLWILDLLEGNIGWISPGMDGWDAHHGP